MPQIQGDMTIIGNKKIVSTKDNSHHNIMIFISFSLFIDAILHLLTKPHIKASLFSAVDDSGFEFLFQKSHQDTIKTLYRKIVIDELSINNFIKQILSSLAEISANFESIVNANPDDLALSDFMTYIINSSNCHLTRQTKLDLYVLRALRRLSI